MSTIHVQAIINGLLTGGIYGLAALGLSLIWGVMKVVNVAHGDMLMIAAYATFFLVVGGVNPFVTLALLLPLGFVAGALLYRVIIRHLVERSEVELMSLVLTFGLGAMIYGAAANAWGQDLRSIPLLLPTLKVGAVRVPWSRLSAFIISLGLMVALYLFLRRTYIGKAIRAVAQSRTAAMAMGIDPGQISMIAFGIGLGYAAVAGGLIALTNPLSPIIGLNYVGRAFAVVVLGGLGNPIGAVVGGLVLGLAESISALFVTYSLAPAVAFLLLIIVLIVRPRGLFGPLG
ncbi:MAG: branched-chain amino acid ABC transporter permease [Chloroflexi bacterium]|nr:MAG: branched-chain amino acid ABC transporter permease [Chloroflexota bacterium]